MLVLFQIYKLTFVRHGPAIFLTHHKLNKICLYVDQVPLDKQELEEKQSAGSVPSEFHMNFI